MDELVEKNIIQFEKKQNYFELAIEKIQKELKSFTGGPKEKAVSKFVASTLTHFCQENERFAEIVYKTVRTLSDCCAEVMSGVGNQISDIDVYRKAVKSYFPNSDIEFKMEIHLTGEAPSDEEIQKKPVIKKKQTKQADKQRQLTGTEKSQKNKSGSAGNSGNKSKNKKASGKPKTETIQLSLFGEE